MKNKDLILYCVGNEIRRVKNEMSCFAGLHPELVAMEKKLIDLYNSLKEA